MKNVIVVICFSRPDLLENCLKSVLAAETNESFTKIIIQQEGFSSVDLVVEKYKSFFDLIVKVKRTSNATHNISNNRYLAYTIGFEHFLADYVIVFEDDVVIASDALIFADEMHRKFRSNKSFRAVNFGSGVEFKEENRYTFSKVRYALQGPASLIPRSTWTAISRKGIERLLTKGIFDGVIECLVKNGFVVMPNVSRYRDFGFVGTHATGEGTSEYFAKLMNSSAPDKVHVMEPFKERYVSQNWRNDCVRYRKRDNTHYYLRSLVIFNSDVRPFKDIANTYFIFRRLLMRVQRRRG